MSLQKLKFPASTDHVKQCLNDVGLFEASKMEKLNIIHEAVDALVERWRLATFIFHLPCKEATITLKDVKLIIELMIDEMVVIGSSAIDTTILWDVARCCVLKEVYGGIRWEPTTVHVVEAPYQTDPSTSCR